LNYAAPVKNSSRPLTTTLAKKPPVSSNDLDSCLREVDDIISLNGNGVVRDAFSRAKGDVEVFFGILMPGCGLRVGKKECGTGG
jgi:hypothetical protein